MYSFDSKSTGSFDSTKVTLEALDYLAKFAKYATKATGGIIVGQVRNVAKLELKRKSRSPRKLAVPIRNSELRAVIAYVDQQAEVVSAQVIEDLTDGQVLKESDCLRMLKVDVFGLLKVKDINKCKGTVMTLLKEWKYGRYSEGASFKDYMDRLSGELILDE